MISPGALDMCGLLITPREEDFKALTPERAASVLQEVTMTFEELEPVIKEVSGDENTIEHKSKTDSCSTRRPRRWSYLREGSRRDWR